jgi:hypothetical protein
VIRVVTLTTVDGRTKVDERQVDAAALATVHGSVWAPASGVRFEQSPPGSALEWHDAPCRQYVLTLTGRLRFTTPDGDSFLLGPCDVLVAEDVSGSGHRWELVDDQPWTRAYVRLDSDDDGPGPVNG